MVLNKFSYHAQPVVGNNLLNRELNEHMAFDNTSRNADAVVMADDELSLRRGARRQVDAIQDCAGLNKCFDDADCFLSNS